MEILGYFLALVVGVSLGLIGSGGSILTLPILVYLMGIDPILATAYSLFVVGTTALIGGINNALQGQVHFKSVFVFGLPSILAVYLTRAYLLPFIPETILSSSGFTLSKSVALMMLFAIVMILASLAMINPCKNCNENKNSTLQYNYPVILLEGLTVGVLTGLVGAGGGFLVIPALVLLAQMPMKLAVGTSLFIIAIKSLLGFLGDLQTSHTLIDWKLLIYFTLLSVLGIFIGMLLAKTIKANQLKTAFGVFILIMGTYILIKELLF